MPETRNPIDLEDQDEALPVIRETSRGANEPPPEGERSARAERGLRRSRERASVDRRGTQARPARKPIVEGSVSVG
jgi:hypothetical protein